MDLNQNDVFWIWFNDGSDMIAGNPGWLTNLPNGTVFPVPETLATGDGSGAANDIWLTYIPEPSSGGTLAALLGTYALRRRRR